MIVKKITSSFAKGLLVIVPIALTIWAIVSVVSVLDSLLRVEDWFEIHIPGLGLVVALAGITAIGFLAANSIGRRVFALIEAALCKIPVVKLLFGSLKDLLDAFVGDTRTFEQPVMIEVAPGIRAFGFVTTDRFDDPALKGQVAVYLPQSYNFAGNLIIVDREKVKSVDASGAQFMAFIVSGGVASLQASETILEAPRFSPRDSYVPPKEIGERD